MTPSSLIAVVLLAAPALPPPLAVIEPPPGLGAAVLQASEAMALLEKNDAAGSLVHFDAAWKDGIRSGEIAYDAACAEARLKKPEAAMEWLARAQQSGWSDADALAADEDLVSLRARPDWKPLLDKVRATPPKAGNAELKSLVAADQADRQHVPGDPQGIQEMMGRDRARLARVKELVNAGAPHTGDDFFAAALVLQHSETLDDYALARTVALEAAKRGRSSALTLSAAAWDRWLMKAGYPQRFGTQYAPKKSEPRTFELVPIDPATTDAERAKWGVKPLAEISKTMTLH